MHILDLPDPAAARAFAVAVAVAVAEPGYQAGAYRDVLLRRWKNCWGRTMWEHHGYGQDRQRYLVLGSPSSTSQTEPTRHARTR